MTAIKSNPGIASRFRGRGSRDKLIECLMGQPLIGGDSDLASRFAALVKIVECRGGKRITQQGSSDNDMYFILRGRVSISVNGREIAVRDAGGHFGEMALLEPTAVRSATTTAVENCVLARITEQRFQSIARTHTDLWQRIAVTLAKRLRERGRFHSQPHRRPHLFIGSSTEGLKVAQCLEKELKGSRIHTLLWTIGVFQPSKFTIEDLTAQASSSDFAVIVLTPDDITKSRRRKLNAPRDNVIFELGFFMGALSRERTFIVMPVGANVKIPTDLWGITHLSYNPRGPGSLAKKLQAVSLQIRTRINALGTR